MAKFRVVLQTVYHIECRSPKEASDEAFNQLEIEILDTPIRELFRWSLTKEAPG